MVVVVGTALGGIVQLGVDAGDLAGGAEGEGDDALIAAIVGQVVAGIVERAVRVGDSGFVHDGGELGAAYVLQALQQGRVQPGAGNVWAGALLGGVVPAGGIIEGLGGAGQQGRKN